MDIDFGKASAVAERLTDARSGKVMFLAHCLLNTHTRYAGGACRACCVDEVVRQCMDLGLGMVQLPCPEEAAWGGVRKRWVLRLIGARRAGPARRLVARLAAMLAAPYSRLRFARLARAAVRQIADYHASGYEVVAVVGIDGSPSCGVRTTLPLARSVETLAGLERDGLDAARINAVVAGLAGPGEGIFLGQLRRGLARRGLQVPVIGYDLIAELRGEARPVPLAEVIRR